MARMIYLVELEIEADTAADLPVSEGPALEGMPQRDPLDLMLLKATAEYIARLGGGYSVEGIEVIGTREG